MGRTRVSHTSRRSTSKCGLLSESHLVASLVDHVRSTTTPRRRTVGDNGTHGRPNRLACIYTRLLWILALLSTLRAGVSANGNETARYRIDAQFARYLCLCGKIGNDHEQSRILRHLLQSATYSYSLSCASQARALARSHRQFPKRASQTASRPF